MKKCYLRGFGNCVGKISSEHFISKNIREYTSNGNHSGKIGGLSWQPYNTMQLFGNNSLVSNILCEGHNSSLSCLDAEAGRLFKFLDMADKKPTLVPDLTFFDGQLLERWLLKTICGLVASKQVRSGVVTDEWKGLVTGHRWPEKWGLYFRDDFGPTITTGGFHLETKINPSSGEILAVVFVFAGVHLNLCLGRPDNPHRWGVWHPEALVFRNGEQDKRFAFRWENSSGRTVTYVRTGTTTDRPEHENNWIE